MLGLAAFQALRGHARRSSPPSRPEVGLLWTVLLIQSLSCVRLFATPWTVARQAYLSFTISQSLLKLMSTESVMPSNHHLILYQC